MAAGAKKAHAGSGSIAWMAGHTVAANLAMLTCLVGGLLMMGHIKQELMPDTERPLVFVSVSYPGAGPAEVERGLILAIEEAVQGLEGVKEVVSTAGEGSGTVEIEALRGANVQKLADDVRSAVSRITTLPEDAEQPEVSVASHFRGVLSLLLYGPVDVEILHELAEQTRDQLLQNEDITQVMINGLPPLEIAVEVPQENLRRYGLTLGDIADRLKSDSVERSGGSVKAVSGEILVRVTERREWGSEFAASPIVTTSDGSQILLGDIATIMDGCADKDRSLNCEGCPAVSLRVNRVGDQTPLRVSEAVESELAGIRAGLPEGVHAMVQWDRAVEYRERIQLLLKNGLMGLSLVLILLGLFLEARLAFWVMMGVPISFLGSFLFLPAADVTLNMVSLFAYIIACGIVVDDAIVVGENVFRYRQRGMPFAQAAVRGAREVAMPVTFSVLTNCVAFLPICFIPGTIGKIFWMIPVVVCIAFVISLFESLFILPAHLGGHSGRRVPRGPLRWLHGRQQAFSDGFSRLIQRRWGAILAFVLRHRLVTIALAASVLSLTLSYAGSNRMGFTIFPMIESDDAVVTVALPYGAPVAKTRELLNRLETAARQVIRETGHPELAERITSDVGRWGSHYGLVRVRLARPKIREKIMNTSDFIRRWREIAGEVTGVEYIRFASNAGGPAGGGRPLSVHLSHRDMNVLTKASAELAGILGAYPRVSDADDGFEEGKSQMDVTITPEGRSLGLTSDDVASQVRAAFYGAEAVRQQRGRSEVKVMVRLPKTDRSTEQTINDLMIRTPAGAFAPFRDVASFTRRRASMSIHRRNCRRVLEVSADITPRSRAGEVIADLKANVLPSLQGRYPGLLWSFEGYRADMRESLGSLKETFPVALLVIYAMLAVSFRSYVQPLIVMTSIPFGVVGAFLGHLVMGYDLCLPSLFGIVALAGVVVNDSLVLVDFANRRRREACVSAREAVIDASVTRFRPVILTTLTTFGGLAPMIFETSRQARFLIPMALSLGFGILFATFVTLVLVPALYVCVEDVAGIARAVGRFLHADDDVEALAEPVGAPAADAAERPAGRV